MAVWSKSFYAPAAGAWHDVVAATADTKMSFMQIANMSLEDSARVIVAVGAASDAAIVAPTGLSIQTSGGVGTKQYDYVVTAVKSDGRETGPSGMISITSGYETLDSSNYHTLTWQESAGAAKYRIYCREGGSNSAIVKIAEVTTLTYANNGGMVSAGKWPWVNMTGVASLLAWCELAPGVGLEPVSRPVPIANGDKIMLFTTGVISAFASGEV
jgi:hypothetical protein